MILACPQCGTVQDFEPIPIGVTAYCPVCRNTFERTSGRSIAAAFACASATLILLFPANLLPLLSVSLLGQTHVSQLGSGVVVLWDHQWVIMAVLVAAFAVILPFVRYALLSTALAVVLLVRAQHPVLPQLPRWLGTAYRWALELDPWSMPDVFLIGLAVGYSRIEANLPVTFGWGGFCFVAAAFLSMLSRATLDKRSVWRAIEVEQPPIGPHEPVLSCTACDLVMPLAAEGSRCPRCRARLYARKPDSIVRTLGLIIAGLALFAPANVYPMSTDLQLGELVPHRIVDGIRELYQAGLWPLGILIFCTSIAIPFVKLVGLAWFLISIRMRSRRRLRFKTRLYRLIDEIGRWSNTDVFTIAVFLPLLQFGQLLSTQAALGAPAFILVVVITMFASRAFDPRLMWDAARPSRAAMRRRRTRPVKRPAPGGLPDPGGLPAPGGAK
ncbi:MAG: paraquat-inducible protein A [Steroidobacteraceae bacterium]